MKNLRLGLFSCFLFLGCGGKHKDEKTLPPENAPEQKLADDTGANSSVTEDSASPGAAPSDPAANGNFSSPEEKCAEKGAGFEWKEGRCIEKPLPVITGTSDISTGVLWTPSEMNCKKITRSDPTRDPYYRKCSGFDLKVRVAKPASGSKKASVRLRYFGCEDIIELPLHVSTDGFDALIAHEKSGSEVLRLKIDVDSDKDTFINLKLIPDYTKTFAAWEVDFPSTCKVEMIENAILN